MGEVNCASCDEQVERVLSLSLSLKCSIPAAAGALYSDPEALQLAKAIAETDGVELSGVYAHCGNTYNCRGVEEIQAVAKETSSLTLQFMQKYDGGMILNVWYGQKHCG